MLQEDISLGVQKLGNFGRFVRFYAYRNDEFWRPRTDPPCVQNMPVGGNGRSGEYRKRPH